MAYRDTFEPLKVTAHLRTGVVADRWLPLDGILFYQACRRQAGAQVATQPGGGGIKSGGVSMPLLIHNHGQRSWYYACSWATPQPWWVAEGQDHWNKRFRSGFADLVDFGKRRGKVIVEEGHYRAYHMPIYYYAADKIEWYCVGDKAEIEALFSTLTHVGKKGVQGWGRVSQWEIIPWYEDWSVWRGDTLMRGVPAHEVAGRGAFNIANYGIRPSYWQRRNQGPLAMPG